MINSKAKRFITSASKFLLKFFLITTLVMTIIITPLIILDYSFTIPKFFTGYIASKINKTLSAERTNISDITISKKKKEIIIKTKAIESFNQKDKKILQISPISFSFDIKNISKHININLEIKKTFIDTDIFKLSYKGEDSSNNDIHLFIQNKLKIGYFRLGNINLSSISLKKGTKTHSFAVLYEREDLVHFLKITHFEEKLAKFIIEASSQDQITYINGQIEKFPIWSLVTFLPKDFHTTMTQSLDEKFLINGDLKYQIKDKKPDLKLSLKQITNNEIPFRDFDLIISNHGLAKSIFFDKIQIHTQNGGKINAKGKISTLPKLISDKTSIIFDINVNDLDTKYIGHFWPNGIETKTRNWLISSLKKGVIKQAKVKINFDDINKIKKDNFYTYIDFDNLDINYFEDHESLTNLSGTANFDLEKVSISIDKGKLNSADIEKSFVEIEYGVDHAPITIKTNAHGNINDFIDLMGKKNQAELINYGVDLHHSDGNLDCSVFINFPLDQEFSLEKAKMNIKAKINSFQTSLYEKINISNGNLNLALTNNKLYIKGPIDINGQKSHFDFISRIGKAKSSFKNKLSIDSKIESNSNFEEIFNNKLRILDGSALLNIQYLEKDNKKTISINADFDNTDYYIPALGITKKKGTNSNLGFELENIKDSGWFSKKLILIAGKEIDIHGQLAISSHFDSLNYLSLKVIYPETDLDINYKKEKNLKNISVNGPTLNLENAHISELFANNEFVSSSNITPEKKSQNSVTFTSNIKKAKMNNGIYFSNIKANFECVGLECSKSNLSVDIDKESKLSIKRTLKNNKPLWILKSNNASQLLNGLGLYQDILGGDLTVKMWNARNTSILMDKNSVFVGEIKLENFKVIKNPIITKLVSFTSIMGILNVFTDMNKIPFKSSTSHFVYANNVLRINRASFTGSYLTVSMKGTIDWNYNDIDLYGKVVPPVYGFNAILAFIPFLGHKTADGKGKGIIAADYSITGKIGNSSVFINPLAIFFPEFMYLFA